MARRNQELEREEVWDFDAAESRAGTKASRTVVSVAFPRSAFALVAEEAERSGMKLSEFIRNAAVKEATQQRSQSTVFSTSGSLGFTSFTITALTGLQGRFRRRDKEPAAVSG